MDHLVETNVLERNEGTKKKKNPPTPQQTWVTTEMWSLTSRNKQQSICNYSGQRGMFMFHVLDFKNKQKKRLNASERV